MFKLACHCLNVQIHTKSDPKHSDPILLAEIQHEVSHGGEIFAKFFDQRLLEVSLNLKGVNVVFPHLLISCSSCGWTVHKCFICGDHTHAISAKDPGHVLVFADLVNDEITMEHLISSEDYSPAYKVVIQNTCERNPVSVDEISLELRDELQSVQKQLDSFLISEESAMEERIRFYEEAEREKYAQLQSKIRSHKNILMSHLLMAKYHSVSDSSSDAMNESSLEVKGNDGLLSASPLESHITFSAKDAEGQSLSVFCDDAVGDEDDNDFVPPLPRHPVSRSNSSIKRLSDSSPISKDFHKGHILFDDVFQFDPDFQEDPNQPFSESDEEVIDTDDSSVVDDGVLRVSSRVIGSSKKSGSPVEYSTSVPINVPTWMVGGTGRSQMHQYADEEDGALPQDAESMAASIKALARSVHGNTYEIFGELPKPPTRARVISAPSGTARS